MKDLFTKEGAERLGREAGIQWSGGWLILRICAAVKGLLDGVRGPEMALMEMVEKDGA